MKSAIQWVNEIHVDVNHSYHCIKYGKMYEYKRYKAWKCTECSLVAITTDDFLVGLNTAVEGLATSSPRLKTLSIGKDCPGSVIRAFGSNCRQLSSLVVNVMLAPARSLEEISIHLPNLTHLKLQCDWDESNWKWLVQQNKKEAAKLTRVAFAGYVENDELDEYLASVMPYLQQCAKLSVLDLCLGKDIINFSSKFRISWDSAPTSLEELRFIDVVCSQPISQDLCARLKRLTIMKVPTGQTLPQFLQAYPLLEQLAVLGNKHVELLLDCFDFGGYGNPTEARPSAAGEIDLMKKRFEAGFMFSSKQVRISGDSNQLKSLFEYLPPLPSVIVCNVIPTDNLHADVLQHLARVLPMVQHLSVGKCFDHATHHDQWETFQDPDFLFPLSACTSLIALKLNHRVKLTSEVVVELCKGLPLLKLFHYIEGQGMDKALLEQELHWINIRS